MIESLGIILFTYLIISIYRYLTLMQKEHYIAGTCSKFKVRWLIHIYYFVPIFSKSFRPKFTNRFIRLTLAVLSLNTILVIFIGFIVNPIFSIALCIVTQFLLIDFTALIMRPIEGKFSNKFVKRAQTKLEKISPVVVGITGSYGKTSTKNHLKELLLGKRQVVATPASWNNRGGISRAVNEYLDEGTEIFIAEMGMYKKGEIANLVKWVKPSISIITAIGNAHLERIGSVENILQAKAEITQTANTVVLWVSDERLDDLSKNLGEKKIIRCGYKGKPQLEVEVSKDGNEILFSDKDHNEIAKIPTTNGLHEGNIACALGAVIALGIPLDKLQEKLLNLTTPEHRATVGKSEQGYVVIDNTFNSNLEGAKSNIAKLSSEVKSGNRYVVTPGLVELGEAQNRSNYELGKEIAKSGATLIVTHFTNRSSLINGAQNVDGKVKSFANRQIAVDWVRKNLQEIDGVLYENDLPVYYP